jgi:aspartyl-tRNA(Asn)/glutamyl-tRNA(Gln) amidotransferase subunit A
LPLAWSLDHVGPMARTTADAAALLQAIAGYDALDAASVDRPIPDYGRALLERVRTVRLGLPREYVAPLEAEVESVFREALLVLKGITAGTQEVSLIASADDRTTIRAAEAWTYHAATVATTPGLYDPDTLSRIRTGENITVTAYIEARRRMDQLRHEPPAAFRNVDLLVMPTVPTLPTSSADTTADDGPRIRNLAPFNLNGLPAISVPCGFAVSGLPVGLQLVAPSWGEERLLAVAAAYQAATSWHTKHPVENTA